MLRRLPLSRSKARSLDDSQAALGEVRAFADDTMNWEALGAVGEIVAAFAVVLSLIYLAAQIRTNTRQVDELIRSQRQTSLNEVGTRFTNFRTLVANNRDLASVWQRGRQDYGSLDEIEKERFDLLMIEFLWGWGMIFLYRQQNTIDNEVFELTLANLPGYVLHPGVRQWWECSRRKREFPDEFVEHVEALWSGQGT
jgi:hypothetical protein